MLFPDGDVAVVTGAGRGIGRAIAADLAAEGASVVVNYSRSEKAAESLVEEITQAGGRACAVRADVSDEQAVRGLFQTVYRTLGIPRVLVNNAGIVDDGLLAMMGLAKWRHVVSTNLDSAFLCCREALRLMMREKDKAARRGAVVNIASVSGIVGSAGQLNYSASKGGLIALTRGLAREGARFGVRANAVAPGFIETDMMREVPREVVDGYLAAVPMGRLGAAAEVAGVVTFLASERASYINGQVIAVDGGFTY